MPNQKPKELIKIKNIAKALMDSCYYVGKNWNFFDTYSEKTLAVSGLVKRYNNLVGLFNSSNVAPDIFFEEMSSANADLSDKFIVSNNCREIIAIINAEFGETENIELYKKLLEPYIKTRDFEIDEKLIKKLPSKIQHYLLEACVCYKSGTITACFSMLGNVLMGIIDSECKRLGIKLSKEELTELRSQRKSKFEERLKRLEKAWAKEGKKIKQFHKTLLEMGKIYRDFVDHPTGKKYDEDEAKLFMNTIIVFCKEVFK